jgi:phenylpyruvate tautomerase PptA (4-oxalocrotonate tautomerase family)
MPFVQIITPQKLSEQDKKSLWKEIGLATETIPGKEAKTLILVISDDTSICLEGECQTAFAHIEVKYMGHYEYEDKKAFAKATFDAINKTIGTPIDKMAFNITECTGWGGFGDYFEISS